MKKTLYRVFALLLTASFLFAMASPAFATSVTEDTFLAYAMPADIVTSSLINGIGVLPGDDVQVYEGVVQRCVNYLTGLGRVVDGKIDVWKREQVGDNAWKYGADISLVEVIRSWLFDSDVAISHYPNSVSLTSWNGNQYEFYCTQGTFSPVTIQYNFSSGSKYYVCYFVGSEYFVYTRISNGDVTANISSQKYRSDFYYNIVYTPGTYENRIYDNFPVVHVVNLPDGVTSIDSYRFSGFVLPSEISVSSGLSSGFIAPGSAVFGDAYPDWYRNIATIPLPGATSPDDDIKALPFAPGQTLGDTLTIPQEDVWTGSGSYVDAPSVPGTVTLSDVLTAILSIPANIVEGIGNLFFPAVDGLTMSLSDFFPFCIPYDLFEFFTLLRAEPEAPKFEWKIPVPQLGRTFEVEVDLSAWDEVAQLFRNLELLAFIVGLAFVTREKFLRS